jgi:hypothetical protein
MKIHKLSKNKLPRIFTICDTLDCDDGICNVVIPKCKGDDYGQEIVKIIVAKNEAADFASLAAMAVEANWDTKLAFSCTGASKNDRLVIIGDVYDGVKPTSDTETEPAPYGVTELVNKTHTITFALKRWETSLIDEINLLQCRNTLKFWYLTDTGWVFGGVTGFTNAAIVWGDMEHNGPGGGRPKTSNTITYKKVELTTPVFTPFLKAKQNP